EARRLVPQGGVRINGVGVGDPSLDWTVEPGAVVQVGRRRVARVIVAESGPALDGWGAETSRSPGPNQPEAPVNRPKTSENSACIAGLPPSVHSCKTETRPLARHIPARGGIFSVPSHQRNRRRSLLPP